MPVPVAARSKAQVCGRSPAEIVVSNTTGAWPFVSCECRICQVQVSATSRSLIQRSPTDWVYPPFLGTSSLRIPEDGDSMPSRNLCKCLLASAAQQSKGLETMQLLWEYQTSLMSLLDTFAAKLFHNILPNCRSQQPRGLRRRSAAARLLRLWVRIPPGAWKFVCQDCCVLSGRGLCDELITRPEDFYQLWCVVVCDLETSRMRRP